MKVAALAALSVLIVLPAIAGQVHRQNGSPTATCDNDGHCTTFASAVSASSARRNRPKAQSTIAAAAAATPAAATPAAVTVPLPPPKPALDANGNRAGIVISSKTGARARVGVAYAARFQAYIDDLERNHGAKVLFMGGIRPGPCSVASEHPCGKALDLC